MVNLFLLKRLNVLLLIGFSSFNTLELRLLEIAFILSMQL